MRQKPISETAKKMLKEAGFKESDLTAQERRELQQEADDKDNGIIVLDGVLWWKRMKGQFPEGAMRE